MWDISVCTIVARKQEASRKVVLHIEEQNRLEKSDALELIEITGKKKKLEIIRRYTSHYILGLKVCERDANLQEMHFFSRL